MSMASQQKVSWNASNEHSHKRQKHSNVTMCLLRLGAAFRN
jgi:hypothetical protein